MPVKRQCRVCSSINEKVSRGYSTRRSLWDGKAFSKCWESTGKHIFPLEVFLMSLASERSHLSSTEPVRCPPSLNLFWRKLWGRACMGLCCPSKAQCPAAYPAYQLQQFGNMITHSGSIFLCFFTVTEKKKRKKLLTKFKISKL